MSLSDNFSNNLLYLRKIHNHTLTQFADEISISRSHLQNVLKGFCNPTLDTVEQVAEGLRIDPILLLSASCRVEPAQMSPQFLQSVLEMKSHLQAIIQILDAMLPEELKIQETK